MTKVNGLQKFNREIICFDIRDRLTQEPILLTNVIIYDET